MQRNARRAKAQPKRNIRVNAGNAPPKREGGAAPKRVVVTVFCDANGECRVEPRDAYVRSGGAVAFRSEVGPLTVFVPTPSREADLFPRTRGPVFAVPARGKTLTVTAAKTKEPVFYTYSVYCRKQGSFARASFPRMIVV